MNSKGPRFGAQASNQCTRSLTFALALSELRASVTVELRDVVGGIFLAEEHAASQYWIEPQGLKLFVDSDRELRRAVSRFQQLGARTAFRVATPPGNVLFKKWSPEIITVFEKACASAKARQTKISRAAKAVVTIEDLLLAIVDQPQLDIARQLESSGIDRHRLDNAVKTIQSRADEFP